MTDILDLFFTDERISRGMKLLRKDQGLEYEEDEVSFLIFLNLMILGILVAIPAIVSR